MRDLRYICYASCVYMLVAVLHLLAGGMISAEDACRMTGGAAVRASCGFYQSLYTAFWSGGILFGFLSFRLTRVRLADSARQKARRRKAIFYFLLGLILLALPFTGFSGTVN